MVVVYEHDDAESRREARRLAGAYDRVECLRNGNPGSKADAINYAVERSDDDYFTVFDADETVDGDFVSAAMERLREGDHEVFQGRRVPRPTGPVETVAYCERYPFFGLMTLKSVLEYLLSWEGEWYRVEKVGQ